MIMPSAGKTATFLLGALLVAILFGLPTFVGAALLLKLFHSSAIVADSQGPVSFVVITSLLTGLMTGWLGPRYPKLFVGSYEPSLMPRCPCATRSRVGLPSHAASSGC